MKLLIPVALAVVLLTAVMAFPVMAAAPIVQNVVVQGVITGTYYSRAMDWAAYQYADIFYDVDATDSVTTQVVMKLQVSPDTTMWMDHNTRSNIVTATVDSTGYAASVPVQGYWFRVAMVKADGYTATSRIKVVLR